MGVPWRHWFVFQVTSFDRAASKEAVSCALAAQSLRSLPDWALPSFSQDHSKVLENSDNCAGRR